MTSHNASHDLTSNPQNTSDTKSSVAASPSSSSSSSLSSSSSSAATFIHPSAIIDKRAQIGEGCNIGAYCIIGEDVTLARGVRLDSHVCINGRTFIDEDTHVFPFVSLGLAPQDLKYKDEPSATRIGKRNVIREFVTVHRGTSHGSMLTTIGDDNLLMAQAHVAHDCVVGSNVIMANAATLAGHVTVSDYATVGAYSGVHQFCRVGREAFIGGYSVIVKDALPFAKSVGNHAKCYGLNTMGLQRRGYDKATIKALQAAFRLLLAAKLNTTQAVERILAEVEPTPAVAYLLDSTLR